MTTPSNDLNIQIPGYCVFDGTASFFGRTFQAGAGISLANADGVSGNTTISATGGTGTIGSIGVDATTGSGTNPVVPTILGLVTFTGGQYASGTYGTEVVSIVSTAINTVDVEVQIAATNASTLSTKNGICHFNSANFSVDSNGFVSVASGGFTWVDQNTATANLVAQTGYVTNRGGGVTYTLPASGTLGDIIKIVGKLGAWTIAQNANQQIVVGSASSTVGAGGSVASTNVGDCITLVCITAGASTVWRSDTFVGVLTIT